MRLFSALRAAMAALRPEDPPIDVEGGPESVAIYWHRRRHVVAVVAFLERLIATRFGIPRPLHLSLALGDSEEIMIPSLRPDDFAHRLGEILSVQCLDPMILLIEEGWEGYPIRFEGTASSGMVALEICQLAPNILRAVIEVMNQESSEVFRWPADRDRRGHVGRNSA